MSKQASKQKLKNLNGRIPEEMLLEFKRAALDRGVTSQELLSLAVQLVLKDTTKFRFQQAAKEKK